MQKQFTNHLSTGYISMVFVKTYASKTRHISLVKYRSMRFYSFCKEVAFHSLVKLEAREGHLYAIINARYPIISTGMEDRHLSWFGHIL